MTTGQSKSARWLTVAAFAVAMAWVEAAVVFYLRTYVDRLEPYQPDPLPSLGALGPVELAREAATMIMLLTVGVLAGGTWRARLAYSAVAFGIWDIAYYAFLKVMCGWPQSLLDWDLLFLLPLPWWGPVLAPMSIAILMTVWGTMASGLSDAPQLGGCWMAPWAAGVGAVLALYVFMADAIAVASQGVEAVRRVLPQHFPWPLFGVALALMCAPVANCVWRRLRRSSVPRS